MERYLDLTNVMWGLEALLTFLNVIKIYLVLIILLCHAGTAPNIVRNATVNCTEMVTYDFIKDALLKSTPLTGKTVVAAQCDLES